MGNDREASLARDRRHGSSDAPRRSNRRSNREGPYARIAVLRPHDGRTVEFEAGYIRHLEWHRQAAPHVEYVGNAVYEYLPGLSRGTGEPQPTARLELTTVDLVPGAGGAFEAALGAAHPTLAGETLWYRMVAGGAVPRYARLRPRPTLSALLDERSDQALADGVKDLIARTTVEILTLRPTLSLGLPPARE